MTDMIIQYLWVVKSSVQPPFLVWMWSVSAFILPDQIDYSELAETLLKMF